MNYLTHRFSNLASLTMLLVLSIGTAWMFSFATKINSYVTQIFDNAALAAAEDIPVHTSAVHHTSSTRK